MQIEALRDAEDRLFSLDDDIVKRVATMYDAARREILAELTNWYEKMGSPKTPEELRIVANRVERIKAIDDAIKALSSDVADYLNNFIPRSVEQGFENAQRDVEIISKMLGVRVDEVRFAGIDKQLAIMVEAVVKKIPSMVDPLSGQITYELQYGLTQGDSFDQIIQRLLGKDLGPQGASFFRNGINSMELFTRRAVIDSNNASRQLVYEKAQETIGKLQKQAIAAIDNRTTDCCLRVHGQITDLDQPYKLTGQPRFASEMMFPSFHWRCRTSSAAYHPAFEENSRLTTAGMRDDARAQLSANKADAKGN